MIDRRRFLGACAAASLACSSREAASPRRPPNILLVVADDLAWYDIGCYGSRQSRTPNIDRLASQGMRFERAFTATAMCAPMRQQMYTGMFPVKNGAYPNHSESKPGIKSIPHYLEPLGYRVGLYGKKHFGPPENYPFEHLADAGDEAMDFDAIAAFVDRDKDQPYCLIVCSHDPHGPYTTGDPAHFPPNELELPPYFVDTPKTRASYAKYLAEVEHLDSQVGECMRIVADSGADDSMFVFCSEQGSGFPGGKWTCYEAGLRQGWIVRWPGRAAPGSTSSAMVQGVDLLPTLIEAAGGDPAAGSFDGNSYVAVLEGETDVHDEFAYGVHTTRGIIAGSECYPVRSIRDERYKLILNLEHESKFQNVVTVEDREGYWAEWVDKANTDPAAAKLVERYEQRPFLEFYDLEADPWELDNLADRPEHADAIASLRSRLESWMLSQGDQGSETERAVAKHRNA